MPSLFEEKSSVDKNFDIIISNPPYFKLSKDDKRVIVSQELVNGQPNIYSIFMGIAAKLLSENGELIFITPEALHLETILKRLESCFSAQFRLKRYLFNSRKDFQS